MKRYTALSIFIVIIISLTIFVNTIKTAKIVIGNMSILGHAVIVSQFNKEMAKARKAGLPTSLTDIDRIPPKQSDNAAPIYALLSDKQRYSENDELGSYGKDALKNPGYFKSLHHYINSHKQLVNLSHQAVSKNDFYLTSEKIYPLIQHFKEVFSCKRVARVITIESMDIAKSGNPTKAVKNQELGFRTSAHAALNPGILSWLISSNCNGITLKGMQNIMTITDGNPNVAHSVIQSMNRSAQIPSLKSALKSELALQCSEIIFLNHGKARIPTRITPLYDANGACIIKSMRQAIDISELPYSESLQRLKALDKDVTSKGNLYWYSHNVTSSLPDLEKTRANGVSQAEITRTAAYVFIYKSEHSDYPQTLDQAISPVPIDPFSDKPLHYRREGKGFVVFCVGETGKYDGHMLKKGEHETVYRYTE